MTRISVTPHQGVPVLRNELLGHLVERGCRSIALETDVFAASVVDDYVGGATAEVDEADKVLATGFSHGFGAVPGNRELVEWLRAHNADRAPQDRVRFHGFDASVEFSRPADPTGYAHAAAHARTAQGLLRYHAAMASPAPDRIATLLSLRAEMMAENLLAIVARSSDAGQAWCSRTTRTSSVCSPTCRSARTR